MNSIDDPPLDRLADLVGGSYVLKLTNIELQWLTERGLTKPYRRFPVAETVAPTERTWISLQARALCDPDGSPSAALLEIWRSIAPVQVMALLDCETDAGVFTWTYTMGPDGFAEQGDFGEGCAWLLGSHQQLLGRILLCGGLMTRSKVSQFAEQDLVPTGTRLSTTLQVVNIGHAPRTVTIRFDAGPELTVDGKAVSDLDAVAAIASTITEGVTP